MKTSKTLLLIAALALSATLSACNATTTASSPSLPQVSLPAVSVDPSAAAAEALTALDQADSEIDANQSATGLTVEERDTLKGLVATIRTAVQTGDLTAVRPAVDELSSKLTELDAKLGTDAGTRLKDAVAQLKTILGVS